MQILKSELIRILDTILPAAENKATSVAGSDTIVFTERAAFAYNGTMAIEATWPDGTEAFEWAFNAVALHKLAKSFKGDTVAFSVAEDGATCLLNCGDSDGTFPRLTTAIKAHVDALNNANPEYAPVPEDFSSAIGLCAMAGTVADLHRGVLVESGHVISTDGQRMNHFNLGEEGWNHLPFRLDEPVVAVLAKAKTVQEVAVDGAWVHFKVEGNSIYHLKRCDHTGYRLKAQVMKSMESKFYDLVPVFSGTVPAGLKEALVSASVVGTEMRNDNGAVTQLTLEIKQDHMLVKGEGSKGKIKRKVSMEAPLAADPGLAPIVVFAQFLIEAGNKAMEFSIYESPSLVGKDGEEIKRPPVMVFKSDKYTHIVTCGM